MSLRTASDVPAAAYQVIEQHLGSLYRSAAASAAMLRDAPRDDLWAGAPTRVFNASLEDAARGDVLSRARFTGWRSLICTRSLYEGVSTPEPLALADVATGPGRGEVRFSHFTQGPHVEEGVRQLVELAEREDLRRSNYELCSLEIVGLGIFCIWLRDDGYQEDLLLPVGPSSRELESGRIYRKEEFLDIVRRKARQRLQFTGPV